METKVELFSGSYKHYGEELYREIRKETYGQDIGQTSWITADEYRDFFKLLHLGPTKKVLEIASGSGGPAVFMVKETGCYLTGMDINRAGINNSRKLADENGLGEKMNFLQGDASQPLPFPNESFDVLICIDSMNHLRDRRKVLSEFKRVLKKGGQLLFTDAIVVTGILNNEEIAVRSSLGFFLFVPNGVNEKLLRQAGFEAVRSTDLTANIAAVAFKWHNAREKRLAELVLYEEEDNCKGLQRFLHMAYILSAEKRLSRFMYICCKENDDD